MILTRDVILQEIKAGKIKINPFNIKNLGPGSYDLTLSNEFRIFRKLNGVLNIDDDCDYRKITHKIKTEKPITIMSGECLFAITKETITLSDDICGWLQGRSRFARVGLMVHITASFMQPGISNKQVLEMFNASPVPLTIKPGTKICQFIFQRCEGKASYKGRYKHQAEI